MSEFFPLFVNIVLPFLSGLVFLALARYVKHIGPMRTLVTGKLTYDGAYVGFLMLGAYLATRPLQIALGPHPIPLIVNNIREFVMMAFFAPAVTVAMLSLVLGAQKVPKNLIRLIFGFGILTGALFVFINSKAIGGSQVIFTIGDWSAYDGVWFAGEGSKAARMMPFLFIIRLVNPVFLIFGAGTLVLWSAYNYPIEKKMLYNNMPRKLYYMGFACYAFSISMLSVGLLYIFTHIPNQWWIYYLGALGAGFLETLSLSLPLRREVQITEHA